MTNEAPGIGETVGIERIDLERLKRTGDTPAELVFAALILAREEPRSLGKLERAPLPKRARSQKKGKGLSAAFVLSMGIVGGNTMSVHGPCLLRCATMPHRMFPLRLPAPTSRTLASTKNGPKTVHVQRVSNHASV